MQERSATLLLVEDEPDLREALGEYLQACGFVVRAVATAKEALAATTSDVPDILLTDLSLPDRRGDSFVEEFHGACPTSLLYIHSGDSTFVPAPALQACGLTRSHVFAKPADLASMVAQFRTDLRDQGNRTVFT